VAHEPNPFTEVVDTRAGVIRARGHLTVQAADLLSGAVLALHEGGHQRVLLDLQGLRGAEDAGLLMLQHLQTVVTAEGGRLVVLHPPAGTEW
jgi:anti-anti-sigma regulatory factor